MGLSAGSGLKVWHCREEGAERLHGEQMDYHNQARACLAKTVVRSHHSDCGASH